MSLNIKSERVHELARRAAAATGRSQTGAVEQALEMLLRSYEVDPVHARNGARIDLVHRLAAEYAADPGVEDPQIASAEDLYDPATGLPR